MWYQEKNSRHLTRDIAHGRQGVKYLSSWDPRYAIHAKCSEFLLGQGINEVFILSRIQKGVENATLFEQFDFFHTGLTQFENNVLIEGSLLIHNFGSGSLIVRVTEFRFNSCAIFNVDGETFLGKGWDNSGSDSYSLFIKECFFWDSKS